MKSVSRIFLVFLFWRVTSGFVSLNSPMEGGKRRTSPEDPCSPSSKRTKFSPDQSFWSSNGNLPGRAYPTTRLFASRPFNDTEDAFRVGRLEELKQREQELAAQLAAVRREKLSAIRSRPLTIGVVGFGRFGQFIARTFANYGRVVVTSRSDYTEIANGMGVKYVPLDNPNMFLAEGLDVIVFAVSILSFRSTVQSLAPHLERHVRSRSLHGDSLSSCRGPLVVDVLSVKEHPRRVMMEYLPSECDILCTHPMFGPDSGKNGWQNLNFVYERTRIDNVVLHPSSSSPKQNPDVFVNMTGGYHSIHEDSEEHVEGVDRIERFLSIWEEEGCRMVPMSCAEHDSFAANSQFITHLMGRILGNQGLSPTPIDTMGFESVLKLIDSTTADSFDLFYGLYKYNQNSMSTILNLQSAMADVVTKLKEKETEEQAATAQKESEVHHKPLVN